MTFQYAVIPDTCRVTDPACTADIEARNFVDPVGSFASWVEDGYRPERYIDMDVSPLSVVADLSIMDEFVDIPHMDEIPLASLGLTQMVNIKPAKLILSAIKKAESKEGLIVRVYNPTGSNLQASISPGLIDFDQVKYVLLNENEAGSYASLAISPGEDGAFLFSVGPYKIVTIMLLKRDDS
jgi:hypothetical protein